LRPRLSSWSRWLLCSFQGPPRGRLRRPVDTRADRRAPVSQNSTACAASSSAVCRAAREAPRPPADARRRLGRPGPVDVLAARPVAGRAGRGGEGHDLRTAPCRTGPCEGLPRKEVIQPHLPVRLPCYDFTPVTSPTFDGSLPEGLGHRLRVLLTPVV
jgi:hypothetical protein